MAFDGLKKPTNWEKAIARQLRHLQDRLQRPRLLWRRELLGRGKKILFAAGLILRPGWQKTFAVFVIAAAALLLGLAGLHSVDSGVRLSKQILGDATAGVVDLQSGQLARALTNFQSAIGELQNSNDTLVKILDALQPGGFTRAKLAAAAQAVVAAVNAGNQGFKEFQDARLVWDPAKNASDQSLYVHLKSSRAALWQSFDSLTAALTILGDVNPNILPAGVQSRFTNGIQLLTTARDVLGQVTTLQDFLLKLLGGQPKTFLLIFQNNNEARATGGFIGTYGFLTFANGQMNLSGIQSIYNLDGQLRDKIAAPGPLQRQVTSYWGIRDSNWFVDFPTSARKTLEFLQKETGIAADGVISMTPDVFENLLTLTGPVVMPDYGVTLTAANFRDIAQFKTSVDYNRAENQPKKFLADFAPRFLVRLQTLDQAQWLNALTLFSGQISQKQILVYAADPDLEATIKTYGADGGILPTSGDYLAIYHSNVGGGKTNLGISEQVQKKVSVVSGGLAIVHLLITRTDQSYAEKFFPENVDFLRVLVPAGAKLLSATGFDDAPVPPSTRPDAATDPDLAVWDHNLRRDDATGMYIGSEAGYAEFDNWLTLMPGQSKQVALTYEISLPPGGYTELVQKQPGARPFDFELTVEYLPGAIAHYFPPEFTRLDARTVTVREAVDGDRFYGVVGE